MLFESRFESGKAAGQVALDLALQRYPAPVYGRTPGRGELPPIFGFHSVRAEPFEALLRFLAENGYRTLTCDEYLDFQKNGVPPEAAKSLLLTFDDGMGQVWSVAWPLLEKYGMHAVVFLIPGLIRDGDDVGPTLEDVWAGRATIEDVESRDASAEPLATWQEVRTMDASGVLDFQAHTLSHNLVFTDTRVLGYVHPKLIRSVHPNRLTMWEERRSAYRIVPRLGLPVYAAAPRMSDSRLVPDDPGLRELCANFVAENGAEKFFESAGWQEKLDRRVEEGRRKSMWKTRVESEPESREQRLGAIRRDLEETKAKIEAEIPGKKVTHLAYPWGIGSRDAMLISRDLGYESNHWGRVAGRVTNFQGGDPFALARIGEDFVPLLRGQGRRTVWDVVRKKLRKNLGRWTA
ncbi:MAG: polysaccharide deacetylase family protein [Candidatus Eisenbacteria bacterium]